MTSYLSKRLKPNLMDLTIAIALSIILNLFIFLGMPELSKTSYNPPSINMPIDAVYLTQFKPRLKEISPNLKQISQPKPPSPPHKVLSVKNMTPTINKNIHFSPPSFDLAPKLSMNLAVCVPPASKNSTGSTFGNISSAKSIRGSTIFSLGQVDNGPSLLVRIDPVYPYWARIRGIEGEVVVQIVVDQHGIVKSIKILKAKPAHVFENAVINAVKKWRFKPATYKGRAVCVRIKIPFRFKLEQDNY